MFVNVLKDTMTYPGIKIYKYFQTHLRDLAINAGLVLRMKIVRTECFKRSFFNRIAPLWNALPRQLRDADSIYSFKRKLVMHYDNLATDLNTDNVCTWSGACRYHSCVCNRGDPR